MEVPPQWFIRTRECFVERRVDGNIAQQKDGIMRKLLGTAGKKDIEVRAFPVVGSQKALPQFKLPNHFPHKSQAAYFIIEMSRPAGKHGRAGQSVSIPARQDEDVVLVRIPYRIHPFDVVVHDFDIELAAHTFRELHNVPSGRKVLWLPVGHIAPKKLELRTAGRRDDPRVYFPIETSSGSPSTPATLSVK
jgi:hypothetical protein